MTWGTEELTAIPVTEAGDVEPLEIEELGQQHGVLVGGAGRHGREPPVVGQAAGRGGIRLGADAHADALLGLGHRVGLVARVQPDDRLGVPHVDDQQHDQSPSAVGCQMRSSPRSSTVAEWVSAPTDIRSGPTAA